MPLQGAPPPQATSTARLLVVAVLLVGPALYLIWQGFWNPAVVFLSPSHTGDWIVYSAPVQFANAPISVEAQFQSHFRVDSLPEQMDLELRACERVEVRLNNGLVPAVVVGRSWKHRSRYALGPHLRVGDNVLDLRVSSSHLVAAVQVESPAHLRTPGTWSVLSPADGLSPQFGLDQFGWGYFPVKHGPLQELKGWAVARWLVVAWLIAIACATTALLFDCLRPSWRRPTTVPPRTPPWLSIAAPAAILAASAIVNVANLTQYPSTRTPFDADAHKSYVERVAATWRPPLASDGYEMYHPPLFYYGAALVHASLGGSDPAVAWKEVQILSLLSGLALVVLTGLYVREFAPGDLPAALVATTFAAFLPMSLYMNVLVTNEVFSGAVIAASIYLLVRWSRTPGTGQTGVLVVGVVVGVALLSKFTALFALMSGGLMLVMRVLMRRTRGAFADLALFVGAALLMSGWYYARNIIIFGQPFVGNWSAPSGFQFEQAPGYSSMAFYSRFGGVFFQHPRSAAALSWLDAYYGSMWADTFGSFFAPGDTTAYLWSSVLLILAAAPSAAIVLGAMSTLVSAVRWPGDEPNLLLIAFPLLTFWSLVLFALEVPAYSSVKAHYLMSCIPMLGVFLVRGRALANACSHGLRVVLDVTVAMVAILSVSLYRYHP